MSKWISVKDRLPEDGEYVLAYTIPAFHPIGNEVCKFMCDEVGNYDTGHFRLAHSADKRNLVTHWMPIPNPPEETE